MKNTIELATEDFAEEVLQSSIPVLVYLWATWCGPCRMLGPIIDTLANNLKGIAKVYKLDVSEEAGRSIAMKYNVRTIPTLLFFSNGEVKEVHTGANITAEGIAAKLIKLSA